jgi:hypothetical protein
LRISLCCDCRYGDIQSVLKYSYKSYKVRHF